MLMLGGPLLDAGFSVVLIDAARDHLSATEVARQVTAYRADIVMISHVGSTQAHPCCMATLDGQRRRLSFLSVQHATSNSDTFYGSAWSDSFRGYGQKSSNMFVTAGRSAKSLSDEAACRRTRCLATHCRWKRNDCARSQAGEAGFRK